MIELQVGDRIELQEGFDRFFGNNEFGEHGEIRSFFTAPLGDITEVQYAMIEWDDGTISSVPISTLEFEDVSDDLWYESYDDDFDDDDDLDIDGLF